jgi:hypothetical protein
VRLEKTRFPAQNVPQNPTIQKNIFGWVLLPGA